MKLSMKHGRPHRRGPPWAGNRQLRADTLPEYRVPTGEHRWTWTLHTLGRQG
jgi:hypothetical protein